MQDVVLSTPETPKFVICIDPGHGGRDGGARSGGLKESDLNLDIALRTRRILVPKYEVALTRDDDVEATLSARVAAAERARAGLFVSIHINAAQGPQANGYEVFVKRDASALSLALGAGILVQFAKRWPKRRNRGLQNANFMVLRQSRPACLIECFFLTNAGERALLSGPQGRAQLAEAIAWGCGNFVRTITGPAEL